MSERGVVIIGAGPAGLTAAYLLAKHGERVVVLEADPHYVGGLSRTVEYKGFRFDIGGHRFFSKSREVEALWTEILGDDLLERPRLSRIYYRRKYYAYPIRPFEVLLRLGLIESARSILSYLAARIAPVRDPRSFEDWVTNQFGARLYRTFFKTYTEKVWGMSCDKISADWAAQRIAGLSFASAVRAAFAPKRGSGAAGGAKSLITSFRYPRLGPGMMWDRCASIVRDEGGEVLLGHRVVGCRRVAEDAGWEVTARTGTGDERTFMARDVINSGPLSSLVRMLEPALPPEVRLAAESLRYRDFLVVALVLRDRGAFADNWIYVHDPSVRVGRIQNFKSWSPEMVPDPALCCYGMEYFCFEGDGVWASSDADLIALATRELVDLGLASAGDVLDGCVVRQRKAYPVYDDRYAAHVGVIRHALDRDCPGMHLIGRNGMHKYNNQDHAMMTAMLTAHNIITGRREYDVWSVNQDAEYHESGASGERRVPHAVATEGAPRAPLRSRSG